ncbi:transcription factor IBH1 [Heracleum sosnowskyi]|uniref:Transcription factor IBH1 n=1 Tax=Heracleum sosnowskyi TaxID=360622 RepID=A0AAD8J8H6_9APIA|nr:transcription factor IBH1 [Heracleum sosnowskyi]
MRGPRQVKLEFMKRWARGLQIYRNRRKNMSLLDRKNAIKLSADVAMASTKLNASQWSVALISEASSSDNTITKIVVQQILGNNKADHVKNYSQNIQDSSSTMCIVNSKNTVRSKKILRKSCGVARSRKRAHPRRALAATIAKRIVKRRTEMLKSLVPGGKSMDDVSIVKEALDYILSLQVQVNVMRRLVEISELA